jgi:hypothetical protein
MELIWFLFWGAGSFGVSYFLRAKFHIFHSTKFSFILLGVSIVSVILHNVFYGIFKVEEPVFFLLGVFGFGIFLWLILLSFGKRN